ncbi:terpene synthase family protein [Nannocystis pusilla]|uniref:Terpene synthase family protein n=1 Tax=Nannocystis pusilla TaxID=889268 RepID=A0A9X3J4D2_9BACT|nr:terpene synthase family protein [Nannocystis pusilla]
MVYGSTRDMAGAKVFVKRLSSFMPIELGATPPPTTSFELGLADLWQRTAASLSVDDRRKLRKVIEGTVESWLWRLQNRIQHRIPDPIDYVEMRRWTCGAELTTVFCRLGQQGAAIPPRSSAPDRCARWRTRIRITSACSTTSTPTRRDGNRGRAPQLRAGRGAVPRLWEGPGRPGGE